MKAAATLIFCSILFLFTVAVLHAEPINLTGTVKNQAGTPLAGADVVLFGDNSLTAETDSGGRFTIAGEITAAARKKVLSRMSPVTLHGSTVQVVLEKTSGVAITVYAISGKRLYRYVTENTRAGLHLFRIPLQRFGAGYYLVEVAFGGKRYAQSHVFHLRANGSSNTATALGVAAILERSAVHLQIAVDTLLIRLRGYEEAKYPVTAYVQDNITVTLDRVSRLANITKSCDAIDYVPERGSGGGQGWGSRYWDCCKPHCSWPDNTELLAANCGIDGNTETECYREIGNEHWTGLEGTKSGCEQDGEAYMCYRHAPFAVCENLAFGFAAVPGNEAACGKCFLLEFDGGFEHGEPKAAHGMVKGKKMIVMASNIGHDVGGGQFDIMIPGGGLGAFRNGCAKQWNVDVNDEEIVGKGNGGFTSKCQEKMGWDADPEDIKSCVRSMCDNLFGQDPALQDLYEGCLWYVDWMHAVDNPTFAYSEVECPLELIELYFSTMHPGFPENP